MRMDLLLEVEAMLEVQNAELMEVASFLDAFLGCRDEVGKALRVLYGLT